MRRLHSRSRLTYALLIVVTMILGLASRRFSHFLPWWMAKNAGDLLYATMAFWLTGFLVPYLSTISTALIATLFCFSIEFLKFCQLPWLAEARNSTVGALVLGRGFHVSNLVCYALGVGLAVLIERSLQRKRGLTGKR